MSPKIQRKSQKSLLLAQKAEIVLKFHAPFYFSGCLLQELLVKVLKKSLKHT